MMVVCHAAKKDATPMYVTESAKLVLLPMTAEF